MEQLISHYYGKAKPVNKQNTKFKIENLWPFKTDFVIIDIDNEY